MKRTAIALLLVAGVAISQQPVVVGQSSAADADLEAGIRQVREGEFDLALVTLDGVVKQLTGQKGRVKELARVYTYLAIAYVGLAQQEKAKAQFLEAWKADKDFTLSPKEFPPSIISAFEQAKKEGAADARAQAASPSRKAPPPQAVQPSREGKAKKSKLPLVLLGGGAVVAGGVALAVAGGGGGGPTPTPPCKDFPPGFVPFYEIYYTSSPGPTGARLVVGRCDPSVLARIQALPLASMVDELFCGTVTLGPGYSGRAYVPTAAERQGDYSQTGITLTDPLNGYPFPGNIVPASRLCNPYAWRVPPS